MSDGRKERWRAHREARRAELIQAAAEAVRTRGASLGMDDVAAASGIAKPVFYRYFADKADLYRAVGRTVAEVVVTEVISAVERETEPRAMLAAGIDTYLRTIEAHPEMYRFVVHPPVLDRPVDGDTVGDYSTVVGLRVARIIGDMLRAMGLDSGAAEPWGFGIVGLVRSAADRWLEQQTMSRTALTEYLSELLWAGLAGAYVAAGVSVDSAPNARVLRPAAAAGSG